MPQRFGTVAVIGLGYIGLPTAAILAHNGVKVIGVDVSQKHVDAVNSGRVPFVEPDLEAYVTRGVTHGLLRAQTEMPCADIYIIAVPTPFAEDHQADLSYIDAATDAIIPCLGGGELIILESTSPPGATERIADRVHAAHPQLSTSGKPVQFAHCPERVLPGRVMIELVTNDRVVGGLTPEAALRARDLYQTFCEAEVHVTDATTAEMVKLTENAFRDVNIAFANELSLIADRLGIDVFELIELANKHPRVNVLQPGPGVGGHCIAVDPWFIVSAAPDLARMVRTARDVNDSKPGFVLTQIQDAVAELERPRIALLGLAFKADIDDLRESPALAIAQRVAEDHPQAHIMAVEPNVEELPAVLAGRGNVVLSDVTRAVSDADVVVVLVDHREFRELEPEAISATIIDTKGLWRRPSRLLVDAADAGDFATV